MNLWKIAQSRAWKRLMVLHVQEYRKLLEEEHKKLVAQAGDIPPRRRK